MFLVLPRNENGRKTGQSGCRISFGMDLIIKTIKMCNSKIRLTLTLMMQTVCLDQNIIIYYLVLSKETGMVKHIKITPVSPPRYALKMQDR